VEDDDLVLAVPEVLEPFDDRIRLVEEIRDQDAQAATAQPLGHVVQRDADAGALGWLDVLERLQGLVHLAAHRTRRQVLADRIVEENQPGGILLLDHQERQRRRQHAPPPQLRDAVAREAHRGALVEEDHALEVGFLPRTL
jgi:hypothetical protein